MGICCLFYHPVPALICLIIKDWPGNEAGGAPCRAKQTIPSTVIVTAGMSQVRFGYSSLQDTWEFYLEREQDSSSTLQVLEKDASDSAAASPLLMLLNITA